MVEQAGVPATRPGQHLSARAREFIFHKGCVLDARVALLETGFVSMQQIRASPRQQGRGEAREVVWVGPVVVAAARIRISGARRIGQTSRFCLGLDSTSLPECRRGVHWDNTKARSRNQRGKN